MSEPAQERLQKVMAAAGIASRRASEELIAQGRVTVDGEVAELGRKVDPASAEVRVDGERVNVDLDRVYVLLNKPQGVVSTVHDPQGRPAVVDLVNLPHRLFPVGRLDKDTEGLLLLTNDGELANRLLHPSAQVPRTYVALVRGSVRREQLEQLRAGVELQDGPAVPRSARVLDEARDRSIVEIVVTEGRNREVRRLLGHVDLFVERLARVAFGPIELGDLRQGKWRWLSQKEIGQLHATAEADMSMRGSSDSSAKRRNNKSTKRQCSGRRQNPGRGAR